MTIIGWIIAIVQNNPKDDYALLYIRQMLGLFISSFALSLVGSFMMVIPFLGFILYILIMAGIIGLWVWSLVNAINNKQEPLPVVGPLFQDWFKSM